jgi:two-component system LytT family response regulator
MVKKAIIIDDERLARNELKKLLSDYPEIEIVAEAANAAEGIQRIEELHPDLIFLEYCMAEGYCNSILHTDTNK